MAEPMRLSDEEITELSLGGMISEDAAVEIVELRKDITRLSFERDELGNRLKELDEVNTPDPSGRFYWSDSGDPVDGVLPGDKEATNG